MKVISLFSGAMGLDIGLEEAGHEIVVAVETDPKAVATIRLNRPDVVVFAKSIEDVKTSELLAAAGVKKGDNFIVVGGPCCQAFSTAGKRGSMEDPRGSLFLQFTRIVKQAQPAFFVMENVRGLISAAVKHRPLKNRGPGFAPLKKTEFLGSAFVEVSNEIRQLGYYTIFDVLNSADFGTPQKRERLIFIGSREGRPIKMPIATHAKIPDGKLRPWRTLRDAIYDLENEINITCESLTPERAKYMRLIPEGGNWQSLPAKMQPDAIGGAFNSWGGRTGFLRRLAWDKPSPSLVTSPIANATLLVHPSLNRPLSVEEYARIQEFPSHWRFAGSMKDQYKQIGNAVPIGLGRSIGLVLSDAYRSRQKISERGIFCKNEKLLKRIQGRPTTILNPDQQKKTVVSKNTKSKHWSPKTPENRIFSLEFINNALPQRRKRTRKTNSRSLVISQRPIGSRKVVTSTLTKSS